MFTTIYKTKWTYIMTEKPLFWFEQSYTYTLFGKDLEKKGGALESKRETC